jgi:hypothetical protein
MRFTFVILLFCCLGADAQMIIKAHANYRPLAQPVVNFLLDDYPNAAAAYSLRKLRTAYTGSAIRVRRSNDNSEQDIGFTLAGDLDTASLKTFVGANSGFVTTWYNQADSSGRDVSQSTAANQPRIINAGVVERENGKVRMLFDGSNDFLEAATASHWEFLHFGTAYTNFGVARAGNVTDPEALYVIWGTTNTVTRRGAFFSHDTRSSIPRDRVLLHVIGNGGAGTPGSIVCINAQSSGATPANTQFLSYLLGRPNTATVGDRSVIATNAGALSFNNTEFSSSATGNPNHPLAFGMARNASSTAQLFLLGSIQEQIFYNSDQSANRTQISNNINSYYGIY